MLDRFDDRTLEIATVVIVLMIALVILCYAIIFISPTVFFNPFPPPTEIVMATPTSFVEATWTATTTATATDTSTPTSTWTPTPTATDTPTPLPPTATDTPTATPTATRKPTKRPPPPKPTATPTPWPYYYDSAGGRPNCELTGIYGYVLGANGLPEANVQMRVGNNEGWRADSWTDVNGFYRFDFANEPKAGKWFVRVFKDGQAQSMQFWWETSGGCDSPYSLQEVEIIWKHR